MVDERWERLQDLFSRAVDLPESEREPFITSQTGGDKDLRIELLELLACDTGESTGPLTHALGAAIDATTRDRRKALIGRVAGRQYFLCVSLSTIFGALSGSAMGVAAIRIIQNPLLWGIGLGIVATNQDIA